MQVQWDLRADREAVDADELARGDHRAAPVGTAASGWYDDTALRGSTTVPLTTSHAWARTSPSTLATPSWSAGLQAPHHPAAHQRLAQAGVPERPVPQDAPHGVHALDGPPREEYGVRLLRDRVEPVTASGVRSALASFGQRRGAQAHLDDAARRARRTGRGPRPGGRAGSAAVGGSWREPLARQPGAVQQDPVPIVGSSESQTLRSRSTSTSSSSTPDPSHVRANSRVAARSGRG